MKQAEKIKFNKTELEKYAERDGIKFVVLFGSRAKGNIQENSDFDIAIFLRDGSSIFENLVRYSKILTELNRILNLGNQKIDLASLNKANILLRYEITSSGVLLYGDESEYEQYKAFAFRDYLDSKSLFGLEELLIKKRQEALEELIFSK